MILTKENEMVKFLDLKKQYLSIKGEIDHAISSVINDTAFVGGKYVKQFEESFAEYLKINHCIGVANGTDALEIAIEALDLPKSSEIIVPANSFIASSEAVTRSGCKVRFCDVGDDYNIDLADLEKQINPNTSAIMAVHLYGNPCDMDGLIQIANKHKLKLIEDCAQAHGATYQGIKVGNFGDIATFSFYPGKNLGAYGDGGAIVMKNFDYAQKCRMIANHGSAVKYHHDFEGRNSRLDGINAAILYFKLYHLDKWNAIRNAAAEYYMERLGDVDGITLPKNTDGKYQVWHLFVIRSQQNKQLAEFLNKKEIQTGYHYPVALPRLKAYSYIDQDTSYMNAVKWDSQLLSLPMGDHLNSDDVTKVCDAVLEFVEQS